MSHQTWSQQQRLCSVLPELDDETLAEIDGQLFVVLSTLTDGESTDVVTSVGRERGFESRRQVAQEVGPVNGGTCMKSLERDPVTTASEVT